MEIKPIEAKISGVKCKMTNETDEYFCINCVHILGFAQHWFVSYLILSMNKEHIKSLESVRLPNV